MNNKIVPPLFLFIFILGCGGDYLIRRSVPADVPNFKSYKNLHVGWLDPGEKGYRFGYKTDEWNVVRKEMNLLTFQPELRKLVPKMTVTGSKFKGDKISRKDGLYVGFRNISIQNLSMNIDVSFIDIRTRRIIYKANIDAKTRAHGVTTNYLILTWYVRNVKYFVADTIKKGCK